MIAQAAPVKALGLEPVIFALLIGGLLRLWPALRNLDLRPAEWLLKAAIIVLGATIRWPDLVRGGALGLVQALAVVSVVWLVAWWMMRALRVEDEVGVMLATALSICGVAAAIAACGAIQGNKKHLAFVTSLVILCAAPMLFLLPLAAWWLGLSPPVAGAWIGGTLDTTGTVLASTALVGPAAVKTGVLVKLSQNVLIGVAAFLLAAWWATRGTGKADVGMIWARFPKFVLGFLAASVIGSWVPAVAVTAKPVSGYLFACAFVGLGLEIRGGDFRGRRRAITAFLFAQAFNVVWTLAIAAMLWGR